ERLRQRDPVVPLRDPRVHDPGDNPHGDLGRAARAAARRSEPPPEGQVGGPDAGLGAVPERSRRPDGESVPARGRSPDGPAGGPDPRVDGTRRGRDRPGTAHSNPGSPRDRRTMTRVTVWNEYRQERSDPPVRATYPDGIHAATGDGLREAGFDVRVATLDEPEHGLTDEVLAATDVLTWWGHAGHGEGAGDGVDRVQTRVPHGMGHA